MDELSEIVPGLFISGLAPSREIKKLRKAKIKTIISVLDGVKPSYPDHFAYTVVPVKDLPDGVDIVAASADAVEVIADSIRRKHNVLVHCHCGISRSVSVVIAYLVTHCGVPYAKALSLVVAKRSIADPNDGFRAQLAALVCENRVSGSNIVAA